MFLYRSTTQPDTVQATMSIAIRSYRDEDFVAVAALEESGLHEPYRSAVFVRQMGEVCKETFLVAVIDDSEPVGFTVGTRVQHNVREAWILRMGVRDDQRRKGIGSALLKSVTGALQTGHARTIRLSVSPKNQLAIRLYEVHGFDQEKIIPAYFGRGEDRIIMKKTLTEN
ncbi:MAG: GNAT family N-acetyltransferase [Methanoregula sp.]|jgi:ribosomal-protein-alanine N-acetyltransferase